MQNWIFLLVIFFSVFTHAFIGFGSTYVSMAFLPEIIGIRTAAPLVALIAITIEAVLLFQFRASFNIRTVWRLIIAAVLAVPFGVWALRSLDERILLSILGLVMVGYALYALSNLNLPRLEHPTWAYIIGFFSGLLGGAYNISGPPVIIYGNCRRWNTDEFKSNLNGFFLVSDAIIIISHTIAGNMTRAVWTSYLLALPILALGLLLGITVSRFLNPQTFRKIVLFMLVIMGTRLILAAFIR